MKKIISSFIFAIALFLNKFAFAYDLSNKIYTNVNVSIGYTFQSSVSEGILDAVAIDYNKKFHSILFGAGVNFYYKINKVHPFIGIDIEGRMPINPGILNDDKIDVYGTTNFTTKKQWVLNDFMSFHFKFGSKFILYKNIEMSIYGLIGANLLQSASTMYTSLDANGRFLSHSTTNTTGNLKEDNLSKVFVGISTGVGVNAIYNIKNNLSIFTAIEYQYHMVNNVDTYHHLAFYEYINVGNADEWTGCAKVKYKAHQVTLKLGVQFL